jgi:hypothetical protein
MLYVFEPACPWARGAPLYGLSARFHPDAGTCLRPQAARVRTPHPHPVATPSPQHAVFALLRPARPRPDQLQYLQTPLIFFKAVICRHGPRTAGVALIALHLTGLIQVSWNLGPPRLGVKCHTPGNVSSLIALASRELPPPSPPPAQLCDFWFPRVEDLCLLRSLHSDARFTLRIPMQAHAAG